ncbi:hypothetical protein GOP47_0026533 [Adiantum capillus-veneris]|nr:hypothetical protein GOP47_0026533 [Adiantum capillus-veneris]
MWRPICCERTQHWRAWSQTRRALVVHCVSLQALGPAPLAKTREQVVNAWQGTNYGAIASTNHLLKDGEQLFESVAVLDCTLTASRAGGGCYQIRVGCRPMMALQQAGGKRQQVAHMAKIPFFVYSKSSKYPARGSPRSLLRLHVEEGKESPCFSLPGLFFTLSSPERECSPPSHSFELD